MATQEVENPAQAWTGLREGLMAAKGSQTRGAAHQGEKIFFVGKNVRRSVGVVVPERELHARSNAWSTTSLSTGDGASRIGLRTCVGFYAHAAILPL